MAYIGNIYIAKKLIIITIAHKMNLCILRTKEILYMLCLLVYIYTNKYTNIKF